MSAILFGSISTLADTSELQRAAFNQAFAEQGLDWEWDQETYRSLLGSNGGAGRIAAWAQDHGQSVDADAVHAAKSRIFQQSLAGSGITPRPGVVEVIRAAKEGGVRLGFVTTTSADNISSLFDALAPAVSAADFDVVVDASDVEQPKPDPAVYRFALERLGEEAATAVAVEDNPGGVRAAVEAGVRCVAFPNVNTAGQDFGGAQGPVDELSFDGLERIDTNS